MKRGFVVMIALIICYVSINAHDDEWLVLISRAVSDNGHFAGFIFDASLLSFKRHFECVLANFACRRIDDITSPFYR